MKRILLSATVLILGMGSVWAQDAPAAPESKKKMVIKYIDGKWDTTYVDSQAGSKKEAPADGSFDLDINSEDFRADMRDLKKELKEVKPKKKKVEKSHFLVDIGANSFMNAGGNLNLTGVDRPLRTENAFNRSLGWGFTFSRSENLVAQKLRLQYGLGFEFNSYRLRENGILGTNGDTVFFNAPMNANLTRNTLHINWINVPVMLQFMSNPYRQSRSFNLAAGAELGVRIGNMRSTQRYDLGNDVFTEVNTSGPLNAMPFKASLVARAGYGDVDVFVRYGLTDLFRQENGVANPTVRPVMAGVSFRL
jgi:opacity protein-like surface antigen